MAQHSVKITAITFATHDVLQIVTEKPKDFIFSPGQAVDVSINKAKWKNKKKPFTMTSLPEHDYLEFTIKTYPSHEGVTNELLKLTINDELILHDVFGVIAYKGEGLFLAGGAGITPFISIIRYLHSRKEIGNNKLIFANKTKADIIIEEEFRKLLGANFINILSDEKKDGYAYGQITEEFIAANIGGVGKLFYLCGPPPMMESIEKQLVNLRIGKKLIVKEEF